MNRKWAKKFINFGRKDSVIGKTKSGVTLTFARVGMSDVERVERLSDDKLVDEYKGITQLIEIIQCSSISDIQLQSLLGEEIYSRGGKLFKEIKEWRKCIPERQKSYEEDCIKEYERGKKDGTKKRNNIKRSI